MKEEDIKKLL